jgi:hypothetical protein
VPSTLPDGLLDHSRLFTLVDVCPGQVRGRHLRSVAAVQRDVAQSVDDHAVYHVNGLERRDARS